MSSYLWPLSRTTVLDLNGDVVPGAWLNFWVAGTTTPLVTYTDSALAVPHPVVIEADAAGRLPAVYMPYTDYRQRVRTPGGTLLFDDDGIANPAPAASGGGGSVPDSELIKTGHIKFELGAGAIADFVRLNRRTIGNAGSGATERANDDTAALFTYLYDRQPDTLCPVSGGRGASAGADFAAGKTLQLPDWRGASPFGVDDMGNAAAGKFAGITFGAGNTTTPGSFGGASTHTLTTAQLPIITPTGAVSVSGTYPRPPTDRLKSANTNVAIQENGFWYGSFGAPEALSLSASFSGNSFGAGAAHPNMPPFALVTYYIKL